MTTVVSALDQTESKPFLCSSRPFVMSKGQLLFFYLFDIPLPSCFKRSWGAEYLSLLSSFLPDTGEPLQERVWQRQYAAGAWNNSDGRLSVTVVLLPVVIKYSAQRLFRLSLNDCQGWRGTTLRGLLNTSTSWSLLLPFFLLFMCLFEIIFIKSLKKKKKQGS